MKNILRGFFLLLFPVLCLGEQLGALTNEDKGQLLYDSASGIVLEFQKITKNKWECVPFRGEEIHYANPQNCTLLNCNTADLDPQIIALELAYWRAQDRHKKNKRTFSSAYHQVAQKMNSPQTNDLLLFYSELDDLCRSFGQDIVKYKRAVIEAKREAVRKRANYQGCPFNRPPQNSTNDTMSKLLESRLRGTLQNCAPFKQLQQMADKDKNFFMAFCMYRSYWERIDRMLGSLAPELQYELSDELLQQGEEIRKQFLQVRGENRNREKMFKKVCSDKHGRWEYAPPTTLPKMWNLIESCYKAIRKTQSLSPYSEFPDWGNAMLEVQQMIKDSRWEQLFDKAFSEYQKNNSN